MYINQSRCGQVQGIDILSGCKGEGLAAAERDQANLPDFFFGGQIQGSSLTWS